MEKIKYETRQEKDVEAMFDSIASKYDVLNHLLSANQDKRWRKVLAKKIGKINLDNDAGLRGDKQLALLDLATGSGDVIDSVVKHSGKTFYKVVGVDISSKMLDIARGKLDRLSTKCELIKASASDLKFEKESFDVVTISFGLRNVVHQEKCIEQVFATLNSSGQFFILEFFSPKDSSLYKFFSGYFKFLLPKIAGMFSRKSAYQYLPDSVDKFYSYEELKSILIKQGFKNIQCNSFLFGGVKLIQCHK